MGYQSDRQWSDNVMQPIAMRDVYSIVWPNCQITELDKGLPDSLKNVLDIAGADKMVRHANGTVSFLAQRFRRYEYKKYDDFTLRFHRKSGMATEYEKLLSAIRNKTFVAGYYAYGLANKDSTGFERFRIVDFDLFIRAHVAAVLPDWRIIPNGDGTWFARWHFSELRRFIFWELSNGNGCKQLKLEI